ncbi:MAG: ATP-binding protein [Acidimicrobiales bacterium]
MTVAALGGLVCAAVAVGVVVWQRRRLGAAAARIDALERATRADRARLANVTRVADRLSQALSASPDAIVVCDERGAVVHRSDAALAFERARHGPALAEQAVTELLEAALHEGPAERNVDLYGPPRRALLVRAFPLDDEAGLLGAVAIIEDLSERQRLEAVRRDFVANVSHELKSPIGALGILAETMQGEEDRSVSQRLAERMQLEAFRVARIIDDLLDLSRIESEEDPVREPVAVASVLALATDRIRPVAEHRGITIDMAPTPCELVVDGDRRQLVSAVHNLLENAVKYSDDNSTIEVLARASAAGRNPTVEISVCDHGIGIPARDLERIFERFYRVDRARARDTGGTGLGLAIVRHVATNHGGQVRVASQEGEGSTFTLQFPAASAPLSPPQRGSHG